MRSFLRHLSIFFLLSTTAWADPEVKDFSDEQVNAQLQRLLAVERTERLQARAYLAAWAEAQHDAAKARFLNLLRHSEEPEIRERCQQLLKPIAAKEFGQFGEGFMGISMGVEVAITVPGEEKPCYGLTVSAITDGSPAAKAELEVGDVILSIDGHRWHEPQSTIDMKNGLSAKIRAAGAGNKPRFGIWRGKQWIEVEVLLTRRPTDLELLPMKLLANGGVRMDEKELNKLMEEEKNSGAFFSEWLERQLATPPAK